ncbi:MAG: bifunctional DNA-formamidopyrimidine glycosylase/DNA-(apurinic or apyrimidinic site) lyase [Gemmatimonadaceae bacterium]
MPELPETETIARDLAELLPGRRIETVRVPRRDVLRGDLRRRFEAIQEGREFVRIWRRAKTVVMSLTGDHHLLVTPRFTGSLQFGAVQDEYAAIHWRLDGGATLIYRDVRRLGTVTLANGRMLEAFDHGLGIEPLTSAFTGERLSGILRGSRSGVKKVLMDQRRIAGVGNIYANEALWRAAIDPSRAAGRLSRDECDRLARELRDLLLEGIDARGTTFRDYRDARNQRGSFAAQLRVYGRGGQPCHRCSTRLTETHAIDGRSTVLCHKCQR